MKVVLLVSYSSMKKKLEWFGWFLTQKIDFESQNFAIFTARFLIGRWSAKDLLQWESAIYHSTYSNSQIMGEIKPFLSSCTFIFDHIFYCAFFIILILVGIDKKENQFGNNLEWFHSFDMKIHKKLPKKSQNLLKVLPKTVLFRNIALIFSSEKPCYLENRVVREPCKRRSACTTK